MPALDITHNKNSSHMDWKIWLGMSFAVPIISVVMLRSEDFKNEADALLLPFIIVSLLYTGFMWHVAFRQRKIGRTDGPVMTLTEDGLKDFTYKGSSLYTWDQFKEILFYGKHTARRIQFKFKNPKFGRFMSPLSFYFDDLSCSEAELKAYLRGIGQDNISAHALFHD